jgi:hypothetical protein
LASGTGKAEAIVEPLRRVQIVARQNSSHNARWREAIHRLTDAVEGWLVPGRNPFGLYLYLEDVDKLAAEFRNEIFGKTTPEDKPWGNRVRVFGAGRS